MQNHLLRYDIECKADKATVLDWDARETVDSMGRTNLYEINDLVNPEAVVARRDAGPQTTGERRPGARNVGKCCRYS